MHRMEDDDDKSLDEPSVDAHVFARFADAKGVTLKCYSCGQEDKGWTVYNTSGLPASLVGTRKRQMLISPPVITVVPVHCNNCGYVREFDRELIVKWLVEQNNA